MSPQILIDDPSCYDDLPSFKRLSEETANPTPKRFFIECEKCGEEWQLSQKPTCKKCPECGASPYFLKVETTAKDGRPYFYRQDEFLRLQR